MPAFLRALKCLISLWVGRHLSRWFIKKPKEAGRALYDIIYTLIWQLLNEYLFADRHHLVAGASTDSHTKFWTSGSLSLDRPGSHCSMECIHLLMHYGIQCHKEPQEGAFIVHGERGSLWFMHTDRPPQGSSLGADCQGGFMRNRFMLHWVQCSSNLILLWAEVHVLD